MIQIFQIILFVEIFHLLTISYAWFKEKVSNWPSTQNQISFLSLVSRNTMVYSNMFDAKVIRYCNYYHFKNILWKCTQSETKPLYCLKFYVQTVSVLQRIQEKFSTWQGSWFCNCRYRKIFKNSYGIQIMKFFGVDNVKV